MLLGFAIRILLKHAILNCFDFHEKMSSIVYFSETRQKFCSYQYTKFESQKCTIQFYLQVISKIYFLQNVRII